VFRADIGPALTQTNTVHTPAQYSVKIYFNIILVFKARSTKQVPLFRFSFQSDAGNYHLSHLYYISALSNYPSFDNFNNIGEKCKF
jgi:hypothetical protein